MTSATNVPAHRHPRTAGFTLIEAAIAVVLAVILLLAVGMTLNVGRNASVRTLTAFDLDQDLRQALDRISHDIRSASRLAEDTNANKVLDAGEDTNGNGQLDSDWNLTGTSLTFNRLLPDGTYSLPITYRLSGDRLERVAVRDLAGTQTTTILADNVTTLLITENALSVQVTLGLTTTTTRGVLQSTQSITIQPRN